MTRRPAVSSPAFVLGFLLGAAAGISLLLAVLAESERDLAAAELLEGVRTWPGEGGGDA